MMCMYAEVPLVCANYNYVSLPDGTFNRDGWLVGAKPALKEKNPLINLPYVVDSSGFVVSQSNACMIYVGRLLNLLGSTPSGVSFCEQLLCELFDVRNKVVGLAYSPRGSDPSAVVSFFAELDFNLSKLEACLKRNDSEGPFLVGCGATAPDFHLWEMSDQLLNMAAVHGLPPPLDMYPSLKAFHRDFKELPGNKRYFESALASLPMNGAMAFIGGHPNHGRFDKDQHSLAEWGNTSGTY